MRYEHLPRQDKIAIEQYIDYLKEIADISIDYEIYESPNLYIIYLDDNVFDALEDKIDEILDYDHKLLTIDKEILFSPRSFMVSYEEKIEGWPDTTYRENTKIKINFCKSNCFCSNYTTQDIQSVKTPDNPTQTYKTIKQERGVADECRKAA